jgi:hypothetical protein
MVVALVSEKVTPEVSSPSKIDSSLAKIGRGPIYYK